MTSALTHYNVVVFFSSSVYEGEGEKLEREGRLLIVGDPLGSLVAQLERLGLELIGGLVVARHVQIVRLKSVLGQVLDAAAAHVCSRLLLCCLHYILHLVLALSLSFSSLLLYICCRSCMVNENRRDIEYDDEIKYRVARAHIHTQARTTRHANEYAVLFFCYGLC